MANPEGQKSNDKIFEMTEGGEYRGVPRTKTAMAETCTKNGQSKGITKGIATQTRSFKTDRKDERRWSEI